MAEKALTLKMVDMKNKGNINNANPHKIIWAFNSVNADDSVRHCIK